MTVRSSRLDLTLCAYLMSDGSGSHCRMMSESKALPTLQRTCQLRLSFQQLWTCRIRMFLRSCFQSTYGRKVFQHKVVTLHYWKVNVFDDALSSLVWFNLCFAFDA